MGAVFIVIWSIIFFGIWAAVAWSVLNKSNTNEKMVERGYGSDFDALSPAFGSGVPPALATSVHDSIETGFHHD